MTENVKRPDLNALIADAESYVGMDEYPGAVLIRKLATALAAERARADGAESDAQSSLNERAVEAAQGVIQAHYRRAKAAEARADQQKAG